MLTNSFKNKGRKATIIAATVAVLGSGASIAPLAQAYTGTVDAATGVVWGVDSTGLLQVTTADGKTSAFSIDPTFATPTEKDAFTYGKATAWGENLSPTAKKQLAVALYIGKLADMGKLKSVIADTQGKIAMLETISPDTAAELKAVLSLSEDQIVAGAAAVAQKIGSEADGGNSKWAEAEAKLSPEVKKVFDTILKSAPIVPDQAINPTTVKFTVRSATEGTDRARVLALSDISLPNIQGINVDFTGSSTTAPASASVSPVQGESSTAVNASTTAANGQSATTAPGEATTTAAQEANSAKPEIRTSAGTIQGNIIEKGGKINDVVTFKGLKPGETYTLAADTIDKTTGNLTGNTGTKTFVAKEANGEIDVEISITNADASEQVVFETLYKGENTNGTVVAEHKDANDASQTVGTQRSNPGLKGSVTSSTGDVIQSGTKVDVNTEYEGLVPGKTYRIEARLIDKATGEDTGAIQSHDFTPTSSRGTTIVAGLSVTKPDALEQVAFLKLYEVDRNTPYLIASHEDINDASLRFGSTDGWTVDANGKKVKTDGKKKKTAPKTAPAPAPAAPQQVQKQYQSAPGGVGGGGGAAPAPAAAEPVRQIINAVPAGDIEAALNSIFAK